MLAPAASLAAIGATPYLGVRTHPALAMFSNLRVEAGQHASNHWFVRRGIFEGLQLVPPEYGYAETIEVLATDLDAIRDLQVSASERVDGARATTLTLIATPISHFSCPRVGR